MISVLRGKDEEAAAAAGGGGGGGGTKKEGAGAAEFDLREGEGEVELEEHGEHWSDSEFELAFEVAVSGCARLSSVT
jgi:hypothetical protein